MMLCSAAGLCRNGCNCHACHTETEKRNKTTTRLITIPDDPPTLAIASAPTNCPTTITSELTIVYVADGEKVMCGTKEGFVSE